MLKQRWHRINLACSKCKGVPQILNVSTSADGDMEFQLHCTACNLDLTWVVSMHNLVIQAIYADIEQSKDKPRKSVEPNLPLQPPLAIPEPKFNQSDADFLKECGIDPDITPEV